MKEQDFKTVTDILRESQVVLDSVKENYFQVASEAWRKPFDHCICSQGDYFERDISQNLLSYARISFLPSPGTFQYIYLLLCLKHHGRYLMFRY
jgi:hypothetical protein